MLKFAIPFLIATPALACDDPVTPAEMGAFLAELGERPIVGGGESETGNVLILFGDEVGKTWTLVGTDSETGATCIITYGASLTFSERFTLGSF